VSSLAVPLVIYLWTVLNVEGARLDEGVHFAQALGLASGRFELDPRLTALPGMHAATAVSMRLTGHRELWAARSISLLGGLLAIVFFHACARRLAPHDAERRTLQLAVLPVIAPLYGLVYTDVVALAVVFAALHAPLRRRLVLSGLLASASVVEALGLVARRAALLRGALGPSAPDPAPAAGRGRRHHDRGLRRPHDVDVPGHAEGRLVPALMGA